MIDELPKANAKLAAALRYGEQGYRVFPCNDKVPLIKNWQNEASSEEMQILLWWEAYPNANIAICTDGLLVVDIDRLKPSGDKNPWLADQPGKLEELRKLGVCVLTPGGGEHIYFRQPVGREYSNTTNAIADCVDTRASSRGYVIAAGSTIDGKAYACPVGQEFDCPADKLAPPPIWLLSVLSERKPTAKEKSSVEDISTIPEGQRNARLFSECCWQRRHGKSRGQILAMAVALNQESCVPPLPDAEVRQIVDSAMKYPPDQIATLVAAGGNEAGRLPAINIRTAGELIENFTTMRREVINQLLRLGEVMNVIAPSKFGKSWLVLSLLLSVATGRAWLGRFDTIPGRVLLIDNELHPETLAGRLPIVARAMGLKPEEYESQVSVVTLRGGLMDLKALSLQLESLPHGSFDLIVLDAWYRLQPSGSDENSNGDVAALYNRLDSVAHKINCAFACVHHSSKGSQSGKNVTDVGSGAGAQARAPDTHLVMRQHEADNAVTVDAAVRSWAPLEPFCMRWEFPLWSVDQTLDPKDLRRDRPRGTATVDKAVQEEIQQKREQAALEKVLKAYQAWPNGDTCSSLAAAAGMNTKSFKPINAELLRGGIVVTCKVKKNHSEYDGFKLAAAS